MKDRAIAFDFDGTLVHSGYDKCVHIMYAAYVACAASCTTPAPRASSSSRPS